MAVNPATTYALMLGCMVIASMLLMWFIMQSLRTRRVRVPGINYFRAYYFLGILGWTLLTFREAFHYPIPLSGLSVIQCWVVLLSVRGISLLIDVTVVNEKLFFAYLSVIPFLGVFPDEVRIPIAATLICASWLVLFSQILLKEQLERSMGETLLLGCCLLGALPNAARVVLLLSGQGTQASITIALVSSSSTLMLLSLGILATIIEQHHERMQALAMRDPLTGLFNRRGFMDGALPILSRAGRQPTPTSLLTLDLDHFKQINDLYGHDTGDLVIAQMAQILDRSVRASDVTARYGGEEFIVLFPETPLYDARRIAERLLQDIAAHRIISCGNTVKVTASMGLVSAQGEIEIDDLLRMADRAMYQAKETGRNRLSCLTLSLPLLTLV